MAFPTTQVLDDFNRANSTDLGANWIENGTGLEISSNRLIRTAGGIGYWSAAKYLDLEVRATISSVNSNNLHYLHFRHALASDRTQDPTTTSNWSGYYVEVCPGLDRIRVFSYNGTTPTQIGSDITVTGLGVGDEVGVEMVGSTIKVYVRPVATGVWGQVGVDLTSTTYADQGRIGVELGAGSGHSWDNFGGGKAVTALVLAPSADSVDGAWTDQSAGTSLAAQIDEAVASDSDYIQSEISPNNSGCRVKLSSGVDPLSSTGHVINWRIRKDSAGAVVNMTVKLYQGGGNVLGAGTLIASFTRNDVPTTFTDYQESLSGAQADSITDYTDLYLEFYADEV